MLAKVFHSLFNLHMIFYKVKLIKGMSVVFMLFIWGGQVRAQDTTSTYYFAHSLINHQKTTSNQANIPYWLAEIEQAAGDVCLTSGQYAAGQFGANALPPEQAWSFYYQNTNHGSNMYPGDTYPINAHDNVVLTHMNWEIIYDWGPQLGERQEDEVSDATESIGVIFDWVNTNDPEANLYLYECWPKIETDVILGGTPWVSGSGNSPNATQWADYLSYALGKSNDFWVELHDSLIIEKGFSELKLIPSSMICAKLWQTDGLLDDFSVTDIFEDDGPHGKASSYFLAAMIVYAAQHQEAPTRPFTSHVQIDQRILDRFDDISSFIMTELSNWNFVNGSSRVWFEGPDNENPVQVGTLAVNQIDYYSANLNWPVASDNIGVTGYEIHINGTLHDFTTTNSYTLTDLNCNTAYNNVQVRALDAVGNSSEFITASFSTITCPGDNVPPTIPIGLSAVRIDNNTAYITWNSSSDNYGVESYTLSLNGSVVATQEDTTYTISDLNCDQVYQLSLYATDVNENSSDVTLLSYTNTCATVYTLTLSYDDNMGNVQVSPTPEAIYQNGQVIESYEEGTTITFYRYPASGFQFDGYTGDLISSTDPVSFTLNEDINITANFSEIPPVGNKLLTWDCADNSITDIADTVAAGLYGSSITANTHLGAGAFGNGLEVLNFTSITLEEAITKGDYLHFSVSPQPGNAVSVSAINLRPMSQNRVRSFALFSSEVGFLITDLIDSVNYMGVSSSLLKINIPNHVNIESQIEFRIYIYGDDPNQYESAGLAGIGNDLEVIGTIDEQVVISSIQENEGENNLIVYPNPAHDYVNVFTSDNDFEIQVLNTIGQEIIRERNTTKIDVSKLPEGVYILRIKGDSIYEKKIVIVN